MKAKASPCERYHEHAQEMRVAKLEHDGRILCLHVFLRRYEGDFANDLRDPRFDVVVYHHL